jgi:hypothetical protein
MKSREHRKIFGKLLCAVAAIGLAPVHATAFSPDYGISLQSVVGATFWSDDVNFSEGSTEVDLSTMPTLGISGWGSVEGNFSNWGAEAGLLFSWGSDNTRSASANGTALEIDAEMYLLDIFAGPSYDKNLEKWHFHGGLGPLVMFGWVDDARRQVSSTGKVPIRDTNDSKIAIGIYGRASLEYELADYNTIGFSVRILYTKMDFEVPTGDVDLFGIQPAFAYTKWW